MNPWLPAVLGLAVRRLYADGQGQLASYSPTATEHREADGQARRVDETILRPLASSSK